MDVFQYLSGNEADALWYWMELIVIAKNLVHNNKRSMHMRTRCIRARLESRSAWVKKSLCILGLATAIPGFAATESVLVRWCL